MPLVESSSYIKHYYEDSSIAYSIIKELNPKENVHDA